MDSRIAARGAAAALAALTVAVSLGWSTNVAAGSDAYGYVTQADLWLKGDLFIDQSFAADVPWPMARWTFTPLGYRPEMDGYRIVPAYAPGLPLLMAAAKRLAGQCAVFWVVPLSAGLLVFATFAIGAEVGGARVGLAAAWLVAASPTVVFMMMAPMSDVPAAAAWAAAVAFSLRRKTGAAAMASGVAAAIAILIRPNLAPLAVPLVVWWLRRSDLRRVVAFAVFAAVGAFVIGVVNTRLYGSPFRSGYDLTDAFSLSHVVPNLRRYGWWLVTTETPLAIGGLAWLAWTRRWLLASMAATVWAVYLVYVPWEAWWFLRFLLPSWPMMAVGSSLLVFETTRDLRRGKAMASAVIVLAGLIGGFQAWQRDAFNEKAGESKYVEVARVVESLTEPGDVIIAAQHSGTLRYYAGRMTLRWDTGDPAWTDRMVAWLQAHGHTPYLVLEAPEIEALRAKAADVSEIARLDWSPMVTFRGGTIRMFDTVNRVRGAAPVANKASFTIDACAPGRTTPQPSFRPPQARRINQASLIAGILRISSRALSSAADPASSSTLTTPTAPPSPRPSAKLAMFTRCRPRIVPTSPITPG